MRVAIWGDMTFAMGRVHLNLAKRLGADGHEVHLFE